MKQKTRIRNRQGRRSGSKQPSSVYARKVHGDFPQNSPYRTHWLGCVPFGYKRFQKVEKKVEK